MLESLVKFCCSTVYKTETFLWRRTALLPHFLVRFLPFVWEKKSHHLYTKETLRLCVGQTLGGQMLIHILGLRRAFWWNRSSCRDQSVTDRTKHCLSAGLWVPMKDKAAVKRFRWQYKRLSNTLLLFLLRNTSTCYCKCLNQDHIRKKQESFRIIYVLL